LIAEEMGYRYSKHYTRDEARALLPEVRKWLAELLRLRGELDRFDKRLQSLGGPGSATGGPLVNDWVRTLAATKVLLMKFYRREIQIKDLDRGLIDFPAIIGGREVFLCWEQDEQDIEFWHELDAGYAGRERI
jgi:hypothetical protein